MNKGKDRLNLVRLDGRQSRELLDNLEQGATQSTSRQLKHRNRRGEPRWRFHRDDVTVTVEHPGGGSSTFVILARNLSRSGIAFIHGGFVHPTTCCRFELQRTDGESAQVTGRVVGCRHVQGALHEVRVKFDEPIDPAAFLTVDEEPEPEMEEAVEPGTIAGTVLHVVQSDLAAGLLAHYFSASKVTLSRATTTEEAVASLSSPAPEVVLLEPAPGAGEPAAAVKALREGGFRGPIVLLTAEAGRATLDTGGANHVLAKPVTKEGLFALLAQIQDHGGAPGSGGILYSTLSDEEGLTDMLQQFIDHAAKMAQDLEEALDQQNLEQVRAACVDLKGSAAGYGYAGLGEAAGAALEQLDQTMSLEQSLTTINRLARMCRRLAISEGEQKPEGAAGEPEKDDG